MCRDLCLLVSKYVFLDAEDAIRLEHLNIAKLLLKDSQSRWISYWEVSQILRLAIATGKEPIWGWALDETLKVCYQLNIILSEPFKWAAASGKLDCLKALFQLKKEQSLVKLVPSAGTMNAAFIGGQTKVIKWLLKLKPKCASTCPWSFLLSENRTEIFQRRVQPHHLKYAISADNIKLAKIVLNHCPEAHSIEHVENCHIRSLRMYKWLEQTMHVGNQLVSNPMHKTNCLKECISHQDVIAANSIPMLKLRDSLKRRERDHRWLHKKGTLQKALKQKHFKLLDAFSDLTNVSRYYEEAAITNDLDNVIWVHNKVTKMVYLNKNLDLMYALMAAGRLRNFKIIEFLRPLCELGPDFYVCAGAAEGGHLDMMAKYLNIMPFRIVEIMEHAIQDDQDHILRFCLERFKVETADPPTIRQYLFKSAVSWEALRCMTVLKDSFNLDSFIAGLALNNKRDSRRIIGWAKWYSELKDSKLDLNELAIKVFQSCPKPALIYLMPHLNQRILRPVDSRRPLVSKLHSNFDTVLKTDACQLGVQNNSVKKSHNYYCSWSVDIFRALAALPWIDMHFDSNGSLVRCCSQDSCVHLECKKKDIKWMREGGFL